MAADESKHFQIGAAIEAALATIVQGDDFHYTPDAVVSTSFPTDAVLNTGKRIVYAVAAAGEETHAEEGSEQSMLAQMECFILVLHQIGTNEDPFQPANPTRHKIADRMVRDVLRKLLEDVQLGGLVRNIFAEPARVDREKYLPTWACAEIRLLIAYDYSGTP